MFSVFAQYFKIYSTLTIKSIYFLKADKIIYLMIIFSDINKNHAGHESDFIKFTMSCLWRFISPLHHIFFLKKLHKCNLHSFAEKSLPHFFFKLVGLKIIKVFVQTLLKNVFFSVNISLTLHHRAIFYFFQKLWQTFVRKPIGYQKKKIASWYLVPMGTYKARKVRKKAKIRYWDKRNLSFFLWSPVE